MCTILVASKDGNLWLENIGDKALGFRLLESMAMRVAIPRISGLGVVEKRNTLITFLQHNQIRHSGHQEVLLISSIPVC